VRKYTRSGMGADEVPSRGSDPRAHPNGAALQTETVKNRIFPPEGRPTNEDHLVREFTRLSFEPARGRQLFVRPGSPIPGRLPRGAVP